MRVLLTILFTLLTTIALADSAGCFEYDLKSYRHWIDEDRDCQNARHEVLIEESFLTVGFKSSKGFRVVSGSWNDPYSSGTNIDATNQGGPPVWCCYWSRERKRAYANDLDDSDTLIAVDRRLNRQKVARVPAGWLPPNGAYQIEYARAWVAVKLKWGMTAD